MDARLARPAPAQTWPDWTGRAVAIVASGPSAKTAGVGLLKDRLTTLAIKKNIELCPWAEVVYGCDFPWWSSVEGLKGFKGLRLAYADRACNEFGCRKVQIPDIRCDRLLTETVGVVGAGGNSGFQALNLAVQFGAARILLVGFDCQDRAGVHWYGRNTAPGMANPDEHNFRRWRAALARAATELQQLGVEVINASPISDVKGFPRRSVEEALQDWGLA